MNQLPTLSRTFPARISATPSSQVNRFGNPMLPDSSTIEERISSANLEAVIENQMADASTRLSQVSLAYRFGTASAVRSPQSRISSFRSAFLGHQIQ